MILSQTYFQEGFYNEDKSGYIQIPTGYGQRNKDIDSFQTDFSNITLVSDPISAIIKSEKKESQISISAWQI